MARTLTWKNLWAAIAVVALAPLMACSNLGTLPPPGASSPGLGPEYVIGPLDGLSIFVWRNPELSQSVPVRPDGRISIPLIEDLPAAGLTPTQLARDIEGQLTNVIQVNCTTATAPIAPAGLDTTNPALTKAWTLLPSSYSVAGGMMINLMVQAVACGLTNVVTFMWGNSENDMDVSKFVPNFPGGSAGAHGMSHAQDPRLLLVEQWYAGQFNNIVNALNAVPESGGTGSVLDNSLLMYTSCLSDGAGHHFSY